MKNYNRHGFLFPIPVIILGYALIFLSLFSIIHSVIYGLLLFCIGALLGFSTYGTEIDEKNAKIRECVKYFLLKFGKWFDLSKFDYLSIKEKKLATRIYFASNQSFTSKEEKFEVFVTDFLLRKKIVVIEKESLKEAEEFAELFIKKTNIPFKSYFEIISERKEYLLSKR